MKTRVVKKKGRFIPQYKPLGSPIWKEVNNETFDTKELAEQYLIGLFD
jgi:hypothetical protein